MRRGLPVASEARERVAHVAHDEPFGAALRADPEAARLFLRLCVDAAETPQLGRTVIDELREVGLLLAMLPEFSPVVGRVHHDVYHVYTVDVHSVAALDRLKGLVRGEQAGQFPLACRLAAEEIEPAVLHLATLLHDVGKALGGHDHARRGAAMAHPIGARLGLSPEQTGRVAQLIQMHLAMYHVATRRDLDDPTTLDEFCRDLSGREQLRELYLLTVADISTTSPTALTAWKAKLLDDLYLAADARLAGSTGRDDEARADLARAEAKALAGDSGFARSFVDSMPARYVLAWPPADVAAHAEVARQASLAGVACGVHPGPAPGLTGVSVAADDRPGLLAGIAAALAASRLEVHGAQILSHPLADGRMQAVDLFWVRGPATDRPERLRETVAGHPEQVDRLHAPVGQRVRQDLGAVDLE
ncbi:MAG: HD domain-containing protein, partial [Myxococcales bacterium]